MAGQFAETGRFLMDHLTASPSPAEAAGERFGLFGMGAMQRLGIAFLASGLIAIAAWWALA